MDSRKHKFKEIYREQFDDRGDKCTLAIAKLEDQSFSFVMSRYNIATDIRHVQFAIGKKEAEDIARLILKPQS